MSEIQKRPDLSDLAANLHTALQSSSVIVQELQELKVAQGNTAQTLRLQTHSIAQIDTRLAAVEASTELMSTKHFTVLTKRDLDKGDMIRHGRELRAWGESQNLPSAKELWHPGIDDFVLGHHRYALKLYCIEHAIPLPIELRGVEPPEDWEKP